MKQARTFSLTKSTAEDLLRRLDSHATASMAALVPANAGDAAVPPDVPSWTEDRWNAAMGCKTSELAMALLAQIVTLDEALGAAPLTDECVDGVATMATARVAELEPTTATEALLAVQMVGAQRAAMTFLSRAMAATQTVEGVDRNVNRATKLMQLFIEQVEAMSKLKGKSGQQRVVVEHVTVAAGGQAVVGIVDRGDRGA